LAPPLSKIEVRKQLFEKGRQNALTFLSNLEKELNNK